LHTAKSTLSFSRPLVRKLVAKDVLSPNNVRALLFDVATCLDPVGGDLTPEAAHVISEEDVVPALLGSGLGS
jgi:hypothetical protein